MKESKKLSGNGSKRGGSQREKPKLSGASSPAPVSERGPITASGSISGLKGPGRIQENASPIEVVPGPKSGAPEPKSKDTAPKLEGLAPKSDSKLKVEDSRPKGKKLAPKGDGLAPKADDPVPGEDPVPKAEVSASKGENSTSKEEDPAPKSDISVLGEQKSKPKDPAPKEEDSTPKSNISAPHERESKPEDPAPKVENSTPKPDIPAPQEQESEPVVKHSSPPTAVPKVKTDECIIAQHEIEEILEAQSRLLNKILDETRSMQNELSQLKKERQIAIDERFWEIKKRERELRKDLERLSLKQNINAIWEWQCQLEVQRICNWLRHRIDTVEREAAEKEKVKQEAAKEPKIEREAAQRGLIEKDIAKRKYKEKKRARRQIVRFEDKTDQNSFDENPELTQKIKELIMIIWVSENLTTPRVFLRKKEGKFYAQVVNPKKFEENGEYRVLFVCSAKSPERAIAALVAELEDWKNNRFEPIQLTRDIYLSRSCLVRRK